MHRNSDQEIQVACMCTAEAETPNAEKNGRSDLLKYTIQGKKMSYAKVQDLSEEEKTFEGTRFQKTKKKLRTNPTSCFARPRALKASQRRGDLQFNLCLHTHVHQDIRSRANLDAASPFQNK